jgi:hypothetical protein
MAKLPAAASGIDSTFRYTSRAGFLASSALSFSESGHLSSRSWSRNVPEFSPCTIFIMRPGEGEFQLVVVLPSVHRMAVGAFDAERPIDRRHGGGRRVLRPEAYERSQLRTAWPKTPVDAVRGVYPDNSLDFCMIPAAGLSPIESYIHS